MEHEIHGGLDLRELRDAGIDPDSLIDFSVNVNPFGPPPRALAALRNFDPACYPDREAIELRRAWSEANGVLPENVLAGNGTAELIWLAAHAFIQRGDHAVVVGPTFGEYHRAARAAGAVILSIRALPPDFHLDIDAVLRKIEDHRPSLTFLCNPNNPTGTHLADSTVQRLAEACAGGRLILDEAYRSFVTDSACGPPPLNTVVLRSMTKDFALAGLRLGYALAEAHSLKAMRALQPPWSVNGAAQVVGLACMNEFDHLRRTLNLTRESAARLRASLAEIGAKAVPGPAHFLLIDVGDGGAWRRQLMDEGCLVRDCASFGLPRYVRVGARRPEENQKLIEAWRSLRERTEDHLSGPPRS